MDSITNSLDGHRLKYEHIKQTKTQRTYIHHYARSLWVRTCDTLSDFKRKVFRLGSRTDRFKVRP